MCTVRNSHPVDDTFPPASENFVVPIKDLHEDNRSYKK